MDVQTDRSKKVFLHQTDSVDLRMWWCVCVYDRSLVLRARDGRLGSALLLPRRALPALRHNRHSEDEFATLVLLVRNVNLTAAGLLLAS